MARRGVDGGKIEDIEWAFATQLHRDGVTDIEIHVVNVGISKSWLGDVDAVKPAVPFARSESSQKMASYESGSSEHHRLSTCHDTNSHARSPPLPG
jgi:hypothetical protein